MFPWEDGRRVFRVAGQEQSVPLHSLFHTHESRKPNLNASAIVEFQIHRIVAHGLILPLRQPRR